ncbi:MAG: phenylalanine--tRNA ligase subunit alpha, partial [Pseudomonadota bacterium]|nr:phenylalanine--tRNA ligase subunit alpha [Pseudomonadota bacterium]
MENLDELRDDLLSQVKAADLEALEDLRVLALGRSGTITEMVKGIGQLKPEDRRSAGQQLNVLKNTIADAREARQEVLEAEVLAAGLAADRIDVTLPQRPASAGRI